MTQTADSQLKAAQTELEEIMQWLDWATEVAGRIRTRLADVGAAQPAPGEAAPLSPATPPAKADGPMTLAEGVIVYNVTDFQAAINLAGRAFWQRYGRAPTSVALPHEAPREGLKLWTLRVDDRPAPSGCVIVGLSQG
jgi:hypothetical protein